MAERRLRGPAGHRLGELDALGGDPVALVGEFADARHVVVDGTGHWVQHDLDLFVELVEDFLAER